MLLLGLMLMLISPFHCWAPNHGSIDLKPVVRFRDLHLRLLCGEAEWQHQLAAVKAKWTKCLGLRRILLPNRDDHLITGESIERRLSFHLTTQDQSSNVYCRLSNNWKSCVHYLSNVNCFIANVDAIETAKNPKYTPLHRGPNYNNRKEGRNVPGDEDRLERMVELYQLRCDSARFSQQYLSPYLWPELASPDADDDIPLDEDDEQQRLLRTRNREL